MILRAGKSLRGRRSAEATGEKEKEKRKHSLLAKRVTLQSKSRQSTPEEGLDVDDGLCISHVVLLCNHGALLVDHHHGVGESHSTSKQTVQTVERVGEKDGRKISVEGQEE